MNLLALIFPLVTLAGEPPELIEAVSHLERAAKCVATVMERQTYLPGSDKKMLALASKACTDHCVLFSMKMAEHFEKNKKMERKKALVEGGTAGWKACDEILNVSLEWLKRGKPRGKDAERLVAPQGI